MTNPSGFPKYSSCPWDVLFADVCLYVATTILNEGKLENHFQPISYKKPCTLNVTMLGKIETFTEDSRAILESENISVTEIAGNISDLDTENELSMIESISSRKTSSDCLSQINLLRRLWAVYQIRGYILKTLPFPFSPLEDTKTVLAKFLPAAIEAYRQSGKAEVRHRQREEAMIEAYAALPEATLQMLEKAMKWDCSLFEYPCNIRDKFKAYKLLGQSPTYFNNLQKT